MSEINYISEKMTEYDEEMIYRLWNKRYKYGFTSEGINVFNNFMRGGMCDPFADKELQTHMEKRKEGIRLQKEWNRIHDSGEGGTIISENMLLQNINQQIQALNNDTQEDLTMDEVMGKTIDNLPAGIEDDRHSMPVMETMVDAPWIGNKSIGDKMYEWLMEDIEKQLDYLS